MLLICGGSIALFTVWWMQRRCKESGIDIDDHNKHKQYAKTTTKEVEMS
jgi:hypothetical protein